MAMVSLFLLLVAGVLFGAHAFLYVSLAKFFPMFVVKYRVFLLVCLAILSVSFLVASIAVHTMNTVLTRALYMASGFWLGLLTYLILASVLLWILWPILPRIGVVEAYQWIAPSILFLVAFGVSIFGVWNAFHPQVKEVTVHIPNLPDAWKGKRIVQLSDVHLGPVYQVDFLQGIVDRVNALHPELVCITGDLFDGSDTDAGELVLPLRDIRSTYGAVFVTGNHEMYMGTSSVFQAMRDVSVRVLDDEAVEIDGLSFVGIGFPERGVSKDISRVLEQLSPDFSGKPAVALFHSPTSLDAFREAGINLQLSEHTHLGQMFPFDFVTHAIFRGHDYGLYRDGTYSLYTTNGVGTWGPPIRVGNTPEIVAITLE